METKKKDPPQTKLHMDPVYKSSLVYRPSDYFDRVTPKYNHYDQYYDEDFEAQKKEEEKAILTEGPSAKKARRKRRCTLCCFSICYFVFILLLAAAIVVIKLVPKDPSVALGDITITEFVYNKTDGQIQAGLGCGLKVTNRNPHARAIYNEINLSLFYRNDSLGAFRIGAPGQQFEQRRKEKTSITLDLPNTVTTISTANVGALKDEVGSSNVQVDLTGKVRGRWKVLGMNVKKFNVGFDCKLNVNPGDGGSRKATQLSPLSCYFDN